MRAIDVEGFAGGMTLGMVQAGFELVGKRELPGGFGMASCEANRHLLGYKWEGQVAIDAEWEPVEAELVFGNPPCSGFSLLSSRGFRGMESKINSCMWALAGYAGRVKPQIVVMESVQQAYTQGRTLMQALRSHVEDQTGARYHLSHVLHNALCAGNSAVRRRYFMVLSRVPFGVEQLRLPHLSTMADVISDLQRQPLVARATPYYFGMAETPEQRLLRNPYGTVDGHVPINSPNMTRCLDLMDAVPWYEKENVDVVARRCYELYGKLPASWQRVEGKLVGNGFHFGFNQTGRWRWNQHTRVLTGAALDLAMHPLEPRGITLREVLRLMGFPDQWRLEPLLSDPSVCALWGKGVTVQASRWIGTWARESLEGHPGQEVGELIGERERLINHTYAYPWRYDRVLPITR